MKKITLKSKVTTFVILFLLLFVESCRKDIILPAKAVNSLTIAEAKSYFENNFQTTVKSKNIMSTDGSGTSSSTQQNPMDGKLPMWDASILKNLSTEHNAVLAPMYKEGVYVHISDKRMVKFGFLNYMMMYKNEKDSIITEWIELKPSEKWIDAKFSREYDGKILVKDWNGKIKKIYSFTNGAQTSISNTSVLKPNTLASIHSLKMDGDGGDIICTVTTTVTIINNFARSCPCEGTHTYAEFLAGECDCPVRPKPTSVRTIQVVVEYDCNIPDEPILGTGNNGGTGTEGSQNNPGGGGSPNPNDYAPLNCNPDPKYTIPTISPPPGMEYVLPCSSIAIPIEDTGYPTGGPSTNNPSTPKTSAQILIEWFNSDPDAQLHLSVVEATFLNDNPTIADELLAHLNSEAREVKEFGKWVVSYMNQNHNTINFDDFKKDFLSDSEKDGEFDDAFWNDPNLLFPIQTLPKLVDYFNAYPKNVVNGFILPMPAADVYQLIGGPIYASYQSNDPDYRNACAMRGSRALNYSGITIPVISKNGVQLTKKGGDNKNYILSATAFNIFMNKTFGAPTYKLESKDIKSIDDVLDFLKGKTGIYSLINMYPGRAGYSGHADMIINGKCINGADISPKGGIDKIEIWVLNN